MTVKPRALLVRDNRYKLNWGCRGTSIALTRNLARRYLVRRLPPIHDIHASLAAKQHDGDLVSVGSVEAAKEVARNPDTSEDARLLVDGIMGADVVVVNLEGCGILCSPYRRDLRFAMFVMRLCEHLDRPSFVANAMISNCTFTERSADAQADLSASLAMASGIYVRDPRSKHLAADLGVDSAEYVPDALFTWADVYADLLQTASIPHYEEIHSYWPEQQELFGGRRLPAEYICVSGGSRHPRAPDGHVPDFFRVLVRRIQQETGLPVVCVSPGGDDFLAEIAHETNSFHVGGKGNLLVGALLLARASAYVSGRYHPSVMASLGGTPCVFLESNSHKTESVQEVLEYPWCIEHQMDSSEGTLADIVHDLHRKLSAGHALRESIRSAALRNSKVAMSLPDLIAARV